MPGSWDAVDQTRGFKYFTTLATSTGPYFPFCSNICIYRFRETVQSKGTLNVETMESPQICMGKS